MSGGLGVPPLPSLGRLYEPDSRDYKLSTYIRDLDWWPTVRRRRWTVGMILDQGRTNSCVGQGWKQWQQTTPVAGYQGPSAWDIYVRAKLVDEWPENDSVTTDTGTSVRAGAKVQQEDGRLGTYAFAQTVDEINHWILTRGPVVMGTLWYRDMYYPNTTGLVVPTGPVMGGHCYLAYGTDRDLGVIECVNSWGLGWGKMGRFKLTYETMDYLLHNQGEACVAMEKRKVGIS